MERHEDLYAQARVADLRAGYRIDVFADWGESDPYPNVWKAGTWKKAELDKLHDTITLMANLMGGKDQFIRHLGGVVVKKEDIGSHGGEALAHLVRFPIKGSFSAWTVVHEFAHAWDANYGWRLSRLLEKYTRGYTSPLLATVIRIAGFSDSGRLRPENKPGRYGRKPGCNHAGYFYGDKPSGSNWAFNRKEDFAESIAMYVGWERGNELSEHARKRIIRYELKNGERDPFNTIDNWMDYASRFYPEKGDYTKTRRWQFVDDLMKGRIAIQ